MNILEFTTKVWKVGLYQMKATICTVKEPQLRNKTIHYARVNTPWQLLSNQLLLSKLSMNNNHYLGTYMFHKKNLFHSKTQGCGSGSGWIRIQFATLDPDPDWIWIQNRIQVSKFCITNIYNRAVFTVSDDYLISFSPFFSTCSNSRLKFYQ